MRKAFTSLYTENGSSQFQNSLVPESGEYAIPASQGFIISKTIVITVVAAVAVIGAITVGISAALISKGENQKDNVPTNQNSINCSGNYFYSKNQKKCDVLPTYNNSCHESIICDFNQFLICVNDTCYCNSTSYWKSEINSCDNLPTYNNSCNESIICDFNQFLICVNDTCYCNSTSYWKSEINSCVPLPNFNESCQASLICTLNTSLLCANNTCVCNSTSYWSTQLGYCVSLPNFNESCQASLICALNTSLLCANNTCVCNSTSYWSTQLGYCVNCNPNLGLVPSTNSCVCSNLRYYFNSNLCVPMTGFNSVCGFYPNSCDYTMGLTCISNNCICNNSTYFYYSYPAQLCVAKLGYGAYCTYSGQCDQTQELICDITQHFPFAYHCDCIYTKRYNATQRQCVSILPWGSSCSSSVSCSAISGLTCWANVLNGPSTICDCNSTTYFDPDSLKCLTLLTYNASCQNDAQCNALAGQTCQNGTWNFPGNCVCSPSTLFLYQGSCWYLSMAGYVCNSTFLCMPGINVSCSSSLGYCNCIDPNFVIGSNGYCYRGLSYGMTSPVSAPYCNYNLGLANYCTTPSCRTVICLCNFYNQYWNGSICVNMMQFNQSCNNSTLPCDYTNILHCSSSNVCECPSGSVKYSTNSTGYCTVVNNNPCNSSSDCNLSSGLSCINNICQCSSGFYWNSTNCNIIGSLLSTCTMNNGCITGNCIFGYCLCPSTSRWDNNTNRCVACNTTGWTGYTDRCQLGVSTRASFSAATTFCTSRGGWIFAPRTQNELILITGIRLVSQPFWIGYSQTAANTWTISNRNDTIIYVLFCLTVSATTGYAATSVRTCSYNGMTLMSSTSNYICQKYT